MIDAKELVARLTVEEKVALLSGMDLWRTHPVERLGIPGIKVTDGPIGARGDSTTNTRSVCLPASIALAASFDIGLVAELGKLLGRETLRKGAHVLLAPTINMARHPLGGRNFESFGEEPNLTAAMAVAYITGVQDEGVGACAKHIVANDVEEARLTVSSELDDRTLREVYLWPFEAAAEADVWTMMAAYPKLNGVHCTENPWLLTAVLRGEWGYEGLVMSDWGATHHPTRSVEAGLDLEMPGPPVALGPRLLAAVNAGELSMDVLDERAARVVDLTIRADRLNKTEEPERSVDLPEERELARRAAAAGTVLLTNREIDGATVLPVAEKLRSIALIGPNSDPGIIQGGGSAQVRPHTSTTPLAGLTEALPGTTISHHIGCFADRYLPEVPIESWIAEGDGRPLKVEVFSGVELEGEAAVVRQGRRIFQFTQGGNAELDNALEWSQRWTGRLAIDRTGTHQFGVFAVGLSRVFVNGQLVADNWTSPRPGQAFFDRASAEVVGEVDLTAGSEAEVVVEWAAIEDDHLVGLRFGYRPPADQDQLMVDAVAAAEGAEVAVVIVGLNADWETESHDRPSFGLPGRQDELVARVAAANPRTVVVVNAGGPVDMPWLDDVAAALMVWYPGQAFGAALADVLTGRRDPGGRLPVTIPQLMDKIPTADSLPGDGKHIHYREGLFIGHRWFHQNHVDPRCSFGHGLSYASFDIGMPVLGGEADGGSASAGAASVVTGLMVTVPVTNTSDRPGKCVVQAYLEPQAEERPRVLAGFAAKIINPGETISLPLNIDPHALRFWDTAGGGWAPLTGTHRLDIATSSTEVVHSIDLTV